MALSVLRREDSRRDVMRPEVVSRAFAANNVDECVLAARMCVCFDTNGRGAEFESEGES